MKKKPRAESPRKPSRRKNISLHPDVQNMLSQLAAAEYTTASALLTQMILERAKPKAHSPYYPQPDAPADLPMVAEPTEKTSSHSTTGKVDPIKYPKAKGRPKIA